MSIAPRVDPREAHLDAEWSTFYANLIMEVKGREPSYSKSPGLDKVIDFVGKMTRVPEKNLFTGDISETVNDSRLFTHFRNLMRMYGIPEDAMSKEYWNFTNNLYRTLKQVKEGVYQPHIRHQDAIQAGEFIRLLRSRPYEHPSLF